MPLRSIVLVSVALLAVVGCDASSSQKPAPTATPTPSPGPAPSSTPALASPGKAPGAPAPAAGQPGIPSPSGLAPAGLAPGQAASTASSPAKSAPGVAVKTPSGLEYTVLQEGVGATPALGSMVKVHVVGTRASDHAEFMNTRNAGGVPKEYKLDSLNLVKGWVETLTAMRTGEKRKVHMPNALAYGARGLGEIVPPRTDVDFEIELVSFTPPGGK